VTTAELRGLAWDHTRGFTAAVACGQAFHDRHPDFHIRWSKRSLWAFGEGDLERAASDFDVMVVDHPLIGDAAEQGILLPLDALLADDVLEASRENSVGRSFESYAYDGRQWALPIDAAAQVSAARPDLLARSQLDLPSDWDGLLTFARTSNAVCVPLRPIDALCLFLTLSGARSPSELGGKTIADLLEALEQLASVTDPRGLDWNPIDVLRAMSEGDDILYSPYLFGYSNYARRGFGKHRVAFGAPIALHRGSANGPTLGGAGIAISAGTTQRDAAAAFAAWMGGVECQQSVYLLSGGQPSRREVWEDDLANKLTDGFFSRTLDALERALLRPNLPGTRQAQTNAGEAIHALLRKERSRTETTAELQRLLQRIWSPRS
jgi:multiple sugar transport system substrate-binding protein